MGMRNKAGVTELQLYGISSRRNRGVKESLAGNFEVCIDSFY